MRSSAGIGMMELLQAQGWLRRRRAVGEVNLALYWDCHNVHSIAMVN